MSPLYVLNPSISPLALEINEKAVGSIPSCSAPDYTPASTWVTITRYEETGKPHLGQNTLGLTFKEPHAHYVFPFCLPHGSFSIEEDAVAVAVRGLLVLTTHNGGRLSPNPLPIPPSFSSPNRTHQRRYP